MAAKLFSHLGWGRSSCGQLALLDAAESRELRPQPRAQPSPASGLSVPQAVRTVCCGADFTLLLTSDGDVWSCGANEHGQLGYTTVSAMCARPHRVLRGASVRRVACGACHATAITSRSKLYSWGLNSNGQLGVGHRRALVPMSAQVVDDPQLIHHVSNEQDRESIGWQETACGGAHTLGAFLKVVGGRTVVYAWGQGEAGCLGVGDAEDRLVPTEIPHVEALDVVQIACGLRHSVLLTRDQSVYTFGFAEDGRLGIPTLRKGARRADASPSPSLSPPACDAAADAAVMLQRRTGRYDRFEGRAAHVEADEGQPREAEGVLPPSRLAPQAPRQPQKDACPRKTSVEAEIESRSSLLSSRKNMFRSRTQEGVAASRAAHLHRLREDKQDYLEAEQFRQLTPMCVAQLEGRQIVQVACGAAHTVALSSSCEVYAWGSGSFAQLGLGKDCGSATPTRVDEWTNVVGKTVIWVGCGDYSTMALTCHGQVVAVGANDECQCGVAYQSIVDVPTVLQGVPPALAVSCGAAHAVIIVQRERAPLLPSEPPRERPPTVDAEAHKKRLLARKNAPPPTAEATKRSSAGQSVQGDAGDVVAPYASSASSRAARHQGSRNRVGDRAAPSQAGERVDELIDEVAVDRMGSEEVTNLALNALSQHVGRRRSLRIKAAENIQTRKRGGSTAWKVPRVASSRVDFYKVRSKIQEKDEVVHLLLDDIFLSSDQRPEALLPPGIGIDGRPGPRRERLAESMRGMKKARKDAEESKRRGSVRRKSQGSPAKEGEAYEVARGSLNAEQPEIASHLFGTGASDDYSCIHAAEELFSQEERAKLRADQEEAWWREARMHRAALLRAHRRRSTSVDSSPEAEASWSLPLIPAPLNLLQGEQRISRVIEAVMSLPSIYPNGADEPTPIPEVEGDEEPSSSKETEAQQSAPKITTPRKLEMKDDVSPYQVRICYPTMAKSEGKLKMRASSPEAFGVSEARQKRALRMSISASPLQATLVTRSLDETEAGDSGMQASASAPVLPSRRRGATKTTQERPSSLYKTTAVQAAREERTKALIQRLQGSHSGVSLHKKEIAMDIENALDLSTLSTSNGSHPPKPLRNRVAEPTLRLPPRHT